MATFRPCPCTFASATNYDGKSLQQSTVPGHTSNIVEPSQASCSLKQKPGHQAWPQPVPGPIPYNFGPLPYCQPTVCVHYEQQEELQRQH